MAVDDVVNGIGAANTILDFQPAAGVECVITSVFFDSAGMSGPSLYNGSTEALPNSTTVTQAYVPIAGRLFINNTNYLRMRATGSGRSNGYSGVQTK